MLRSIFLFLVLVSQAAGAQPPAILVLGDSLSAGYGLQQGESWVGLLEDRLEREGFGYRVINASISGDTTRGGLARLPRALKVHQPEIVVIELGGNDGLRALPPDEIQRNLGAMISMSRDAGARVVLAGIRIPPNYGIAYTERFEQAFEDAAEAAGAVLTPFILDGVALQPGMMQADGIHPTAAAQERILDNVWPCLEPLLVR